MSRDTTAVGLRRATSPCWTLTTCPPGVDPDGECGPGLVHLAGPGDAISFYLEHAETSADLTPNAAPAQQPGQVEAGQVETDGAGADGTGTGRRRYRTHLYPWPVGERAARAVAALAVATSGQPCWLITCTGCGTEMENDDGAALHAADLDRALAEAANASWTVRLGRLACEQCSNRLTLAELLDVETLERLDPDHRPIHPGQLPIPGVPDPRRPGGRGSS